MIPVVITSATVSESPLGRILVAEVMATLFQPARISASVETPLCRAE
jgi:hypothetical protein